MRIIGLRREPPPTLDASGRQLALVARFSETLAALAPGAFIPKGLYRYACHEQANQHEQECLVGAMALLAQQRKQSA
ncbi:MAG: hypothetical protein RIS44_1673 [Pseudomonadota bacterium]|jgi:hypothetical protein